MLCLKVSLNQKATNLTGHPDNSMVSTFMPEEANSTYVFACLNCVTALPLYFNSSKTANATSLATIQRKGMMPW